MKFLKPVVITGYGVITPIGNNIQSFTNNLFLGKSGIGSITKFDASKFRTQFACEVKNYQPEDFFEKKEVRKYDLFTQYALVATKEAIEHSGLLNYSNLDKEKVGVISASGVGGVQTFQQEMKTYYEQAKNPRYFNPFFVTKMLIDSVAGYVSIQYGLKGLNFSTVSACASSAHAIISAVQNIQLGMADAIIVAGSEAPIHEAGIGSFNALRALSEKNDNFENACRPFDKNRDGFVMGEGAGALVIESLEHAQKRGANILAEISGYAMNADAHHITAPSPAGEMIIKNMQQALANAQILNKPIDFINTHATSTPIGDIAEINALKTVFGKDLSSINISAPKSMTGHLLGAAGVTESIISILAIQYQQVPPTINTKEIDEQIGMDLNLTLGQTQKRNIKYVLNNNFGFGGHNTSLIFKKFTN
ncbi:MAG: beta-ketoacyl-ACP synthase II [Chitinophagales bacterium]|nr:beta-ketoacyl-ACP synthase II [Chitinophagales bacterium]